MGTVEVGVGVVVGSVTADVDVDADAGSESGTELVLVDCVVVTGSGAIVASIDAGAVDVVSSLLQAARNAVANRIEIRVLAARNLEWPGNRVRVQQVGTMHPQGHGRELVFNTVEIARPSTPRLLVLPERVVATVRSVLSWPTADLANDALPATAAVPSDGP